MRNLNNEQFWIWLAGFVDGEGCIYISRHKHPRVSTGIQYSLKVEISQADEGLLNAIRDRVGFGRNARNKGVDKQAWRKSKRGVYALKWSSNQAYEILKNILPYLVVKKNQATLAIEFQELVRGNYGKRSNRIENYFEKQAFFWQSIKVAKLAYFKAP